MGREVQVARRHHRTRWSEIRWSDRQHDLELLPRSRQRPLLTIPVLLVIVVALALGGYAASLFLECDRRLCGLPSFAQGSPDLTLDQAVFLAAFGLGLLGVLLLLLRIRQAAALRRDTKVIERMFRNVFAYAAGKGEGVIEYYQKKHKCGRIEAMRRALEDRRRDEVRYDS